jgi:hypothetical protein
MPAWHRITAAGSLRALHAITNAPGCFPNGTSYTAKPAQRKPNPIPATQNHMQMCEFSSRATTFGQLSQLGASTGIQHN